VGQKLLSVIQNSQMSLIMFSNPLFTEGVKKFPLKIKKPLDPNEEQKEEQQEMQNNF
jgi:hypothetical protein